MINLFLFLQVKIWFQNRRARERRDRESRKEMLSSPREPRWPIPPVSTPLHSGAVNLPPLHATTPSLSVGTPAFPRPIGGLLCGGLSAFSPVVRNHDKQGEMGT